MKKVKLCIQAIILLPWLAAWCHLFTLSLSLSYSDASNEFGKGWHARAMYERRRQRDLEVAAKQKRQMQADSLLAVAQPGFPAKQPGVAVSAFEGLLNKPAEDGAREVTPPPEGADKLDIDAILEDLSLGYCGHEARETTNPQFGYGGWKVKIPSL